jgi:hypothetical protein
MYFLSLLKALCVEVNQERPENAENPVNPENKNMKN